MRTLFRKPPTEHVLQPKGPRGRADDLFVNNIPVGHPTRDTHFHFPFFVCDVNKNARGSWIFCDGALTML